MRRFFLPPGSIQGQRLIFAGKDARYIDRVLRLPRGEKIVGFDGSGREYLAVIAIISPRRVEAIVSEVRDKESDPQFRVALAQGVGKGGAFDLVVRQGTEIGVDEIYPLLTGYCVPRLFASPERKKQRWEKIAIDAARQSGRARTPRIHPPVVWGEMLKLSSGFDLRLLLWEKEKSQSLKSALEGLKTRPASFLLVVGPEGGFSDREVEEAVGAGFQAVYLLPGILRSVTAPLVALSCLHYHFQS